MLQAKRLPEEHADAQDVSDEDEAMEMEGIENEAVRVQVLSRDGGACHHEYCMRTRRVS